MLYFIKIFALEEQTLNYNENIPRKWVLMGAGIIAALVAVCILCIVLLFSGGSDGPGLKNPELLDAPGAITAQDIEDEYQKRDEITLEMQDAIDQTVFRLASYGEFAKLDQYLAQQQQAYKNAEGDGAQAVEDWRGKFEMLRGDISTATNLNEANAAVAWKSFTSPVILAAAVAYSPISLKKDAFVDWSAVLFPAVPAADASGVSLTAVELEDPAKLLAEINENGGEFYGLSAFDMTLFGYRCRLYAVADIYGYYQPYSLVGIDGHLIDPPTRKTVQEIERALMPGISIDDVLSVAPFNQEEYNAAMESHPEWFDENGLYIGLSTNFEPIPAELADEEMPVDEPPAENTAVEEPQAPTA